MLPIPFSRPLPLSLIEAAEWRRDTQLLVVLTNTVPAMALATRRHGRLLEPVEPADASQTTVAICAPSIVMLTAVM